MASTHDLIRLSDGPGSTPSSLDKAAGDGNRAEQLDRLTHSQLHAMRLVADVHRSDSCAGQEVNSWTGDNLMDDDRHRRPLRPQVNLVSRNLVSRNIAGTLSQPTRPDASNGRDWPSNASSKENHPPPGSRDDSRLSTAYGTATAAQRHEAAMTSRATVPSDISEKPVVDDRVDNRSSSAIYGWNSRNVSSIHRGTPTKLR